MIDGYEVTAWDDRLMHRISICYTQSEADARRIVRAHSQKYGEGAYYHPVGLYGSEETDVFIRMTYGHEG